MEEVFHDTATDCHLPYTPP